MLILYLQKLRFINIASTSKNVQGKTRIYGVPFPNFTMFGDDSSALAEHSQTTPKDTTENTQAASKLFSKRVIIRTTKSSK